MTEKNLYFREGIRLVNMYIIKNKGKLRRSREILSISVSGQGQDFSTCKIEPPEITTDLRQMDKQTFFY